jgi:hypothetical protein
VLAILLMFAGLALVIGSKDLAGQIVKGVLGAALVLAAIPCLVECCTPGLPGTSASGSRLASGGLSLLLVITLGVIGFLAWRRRTDRAKARDLWARRHGAPRARALPAPPSAPDGDPR